MSREIDPSKGPLSKDEIGYLEQREMFHLLEENERLHGGANQEYSDLKIDELRELAKERGVNAPKGSKKEDLVALLSEGELSPEAPETDIPSFQGELIQPPAEKAEDDSEDEKSKD
jgi:hypothetical protein